VLNFEAAAPRGSRDHHDRRATALAVIDQHIQERILSNYCEEQTVSVQNLYALRSQITGAA
jgi:hypothetical protein